MNKFNVKMSQRHICASMNSSLIRSDSSYKGAVEKVNDLQKLTAFERDYADVYETNTRWIYADSFWQDTGAEIPYNVNLQATELPLDTSFDEASVGVSKRFALEDHVHKQLHDNTKLDVTEFSEAIDSLDSKISAETQRATQVETSLKNDISAETQRALSAETSLKQEIDDENARAEQAEQILKEYAEAETANREAADTELTNKINAEETARIEGDNVNASAISAEKTRAEQAENALGTRITNETSRATAAEQMLSESIDDAKTELQTSINNEVTRATQAEDELNAKVSTIESKIPTQASADNQLADKAFVNSSISNSAATYITPDAAGNEQWASLSALRTGPWYSQGVQTTPTKNDYAIYIETDNSVWRAMYDGTQWDSQYKVNDAPFTQEQLSAINSGITSDIVALINVHLASTTNPHNVTATQVGLGNVDNTSDINKPVSTAQAAAIADAKKAGTDAQATIDEHVEDKTNPHVVTKTQVGLANVANERQYSSQNPPPYPVTSVAGRTGDVVLSKSDVGLSSVDNVRQYSSTNPPPYPVSSVNNKTGAVVMTYGDLNLTVNGQASGAQSIHAPTSIGEDDTVLTSENGSLVWKEAQASTSTANLTSQAAAFGQSARSGTLSTAARSDHYHALPTPTASQIKSWMGSTKFDTENIPAAPVSTTSDLFGGIRIHSWDEANGILDIRTE